MPITGTEWKGENKFIIIIILKNEMKKVYNYSVVTASHSKDTKFIISTDMLIAYIIWGFPFPYLGHLKLG